MWRNNMFIFNDLFENTQVAQLSKAVVKTQLGKLRYITVLQTTMLFGFNYYGYKISILKTV